MDEVLHRPIVSVVDKESGKSRQLPAEGCQGARNIESGHPVRRPVQTGLGQLSPKTVGRTRPRSGAAFFYLTH